VGDTPELFVAVLLIVAIISLVSLVGHDNLLAAILLPTLSAAALSASVGRAWRGSKRR
jgi:hypothetical protein